jgi:hypothetical protein
VALTGEEEGGGVSVEIWRGAAAVAAGERANGVWGRRGRRQHAQA